VVRHSFQLHSHPPRTKDETLAPDIDIPNGVDDGYLREHWYDVLRRPALGIRTQITQHVKPVLVCRHQESFGIRDWTSNRKFVTTRRDLSTVVDQAYDNCESSHPVAEQQALKRSIILQSSLLTAALSPFLCTSRCSKIAQAPRLTFHKSHRHPRATLPERHGFPHRTALPVLVELPARRATIGRRVITFQFNRSYMMDIYKA
jgi:hypothetical protein